MTDFSYKVRALRCLDENLLAAYLRRELDPGPEARAEEHLRECETCRAIVDQLGAFGDGDAPSLPVDPLAASDALAAIAPGDTLGRFVILREIGRGAFGVVLAAYDPKLDRNIALKVLREDRVEARERFLKEAQLMARLSHPSVTTVFDVGSEGVLIFIAMELIDGTNVRDWMLEPRSWREVLAVFSAAGRGLAAAHQLGIIHRDFKPANVLIGRDRRVSVTDFGLARFEAEAGEIAGTPAYMAPEQDGGAKADQFSFGVAFQEALCGGRGKVWPRDVPAWLKRVVLRAKANDPADRFESMDVLLDALGAAPARRKRWLLYAAALALVAAVPAARFYDLRRQAENLCRDAPEKVAEIWSSAQNTDPAVIAGLERYVADWAATYTETCRATRIRGEQSDQALTVKMLCLEAARVEARTLIAELPRDRALALESIESLRDLNECRDLAVLLAPEQPPRALRAEVNAARERLAEARALRAAGRGARALALAQTSYDEAKRIGHQPLLAESALLFGRGLAFEGRLDEAEQTLFEATRAAGRGHHVAVEAEAWVELLLLVSVMRGQLSRARDLQPAAEVAVARLGRSRPIEGKLQGVIALIAAGSERWEEAIAAHQKSIAILSRYFGENRPIVGREEQRLSEALREMGRPDEARQHAERSIEILSAAYGPEHPLLAPSRSVVAEIDCDQGHYSACEAEIRRAIKLRRLRAPEQHPTFVPKRWVLARALLGQGKLDEAQQELDQARAIARQMFADGDVWFDRLDAVEKQIRAKR